MPDDLINIFDEISNEFSELYLHWQIYKQLFGHNRERIDLLNKTAGLFFTVVHNSLFYDVQLRIAKLIDPAVSGRNKNKKDENLSLQLLIKKIELSEDVKFANSLNKSFDELKSRCENIILNRKKLIAHNDLETAISKTELHSGISRSLISDVLNKISIFLNEINGYYLDTEVNYENIISDDAETLVEIIKLGHKYIETRDN